MLLRAGYLFALATAAILVLAPSAQAAQFRTGDQVSVSETETINDDLYISGGQVQMDGTVSGDVVAAGGSITINGDIKGNLIAAGGEINVDGSVAGTARIAGGNLSITGSIGRDLVAAGGSTSIASGTGIVGDLLLGTGSATISGNVGKRILGGAGTAALNGTVGRSVALDVDSLAIGPNAKIGGDLKYRSENQAKVSDSARISGETTRSDPPIERRKSKEAFAAAKTGFAVLSLLWLIAVGSVVLALFPRSGKETSGFLLSKPWQSLGIGFLVLIAVPPAVILLLVSVIGIPLALITVSLYAFFIYLTKVYVGLFVGDQILSRIRGKETHWFWALLVGIAIIILLGLIPIIGWLAGLAVVLFGLGAISMALVRWRSGDRGSPGTLSSETAAASQAPGGGQAAGDSPPPSDTPPPTTAV